MTRTLRLSRADKITLIRWLLAPVLWYTLWAGWWAGALVCWTVIWITDAIDGPIARADGTVSRQGALLDTVIDKLLVLGSAVLLPLDTWLLMVLVSKEILQAALLAWAYTHGYPIEPRSHYVGKITMWITGGYMTWRMLVPLGIGASLIPWNEWWQIVIVVGYGYSLATYIWVWFGRKNYV